MARPHLAARWIDTGNEIVSMRSIRAPSSRAPPTGLVKVPGLPHPRYLAGLRAPRDPRLTRQMPLANHLQPTSCHVHPTGHPGFRLKVLTFMTAAPLPRFVQVGNLPSTRLHCADAGWPLLASPTLNDQWFGTPSINRSRFITPLGIPGVPDNTSAELIAQTQAG